MNRERGKEREFNDKIGKKRKVKGVRNPGHNCNAITI